MKTKSKKFVIFSNISKKTQGKNKKNFFVIFFVILAFLVNFFSFRNTIYAEESGLSKDAQNEIKEKEDKLEELEKKAATYQKILNLNNNQQTELSKQINSLHFKIKNIEEEINENKKNIENLNEEIKNIENKIAEKEKGIDQKKKLLSGLVRSYYNGMRSVEMELASSSRNNYFSNQSRVLQMGDKIESLLDEIKTDQESLKKDKEELEKDKKKLVETHFNLEEKNSSLTISKINKNSLLIKTQGEEKKYENLLKKIESQKQELLGDIDELYNANLAEINSIASQLEKPTSGLASTSWYYSQKDSRWKNENIGNSKSLIKDYGCAITSVAMVFTFHGQRVTPGYLANQPIFYWDLIVWPKSWSGINLITNTEHSSVSWSSIDEEIKKNHPVIVFINARNGAGHYVVIHHKANNGKYVVHDPYWGANIYLDSSMQLLSKLYKVSISKKGINQMILYK